MSGLITYNVGSASDAKVTADLERLVVTHEPTVLGLNEVGDREHVLVAVAKSTGYRLVQLDDIPGGGRLAMLIAPEANVAKAWLHPLTPATKVGRRTAGARRTGVTQPKCILAVRLQLHDGQRLVVGVTHFVPSAMKRGNTRTRQLHNRQTRKAARWVKSRRLPVVLMGDFNATTSDGLLGPLQRVARGYTTASHGRRAIDWFWLRPGRDASVGALLGFSSDHRPLILTVH